MSRNLATSALADRVLVRIRLVLVVTAALVAAVTTAVLPLAGASQAAVVHRATQAEPTEYYVSIGDSYAAGYQPTAAANHGTDTNGYAYQVVKLTAAKGDHLTLENFACDGATSETLLDQHGCERTPPGPDTVTYTAVSQATAAERFVSEHRGQIGLVTVSIGGNDLLGCSAATIVIACSSTATKAISKNLSALLAGLRRAAGPSVLIIGLTYPDVFLGLYRLNNPSEKRLATLSVTEFRSIVNPALESSYRAIGARFLDVTSATGSYTPLAATTADPPYGTVPVAVADICRLTYSCRLQDVHPTTAGYRLIARLIVASLGSS
jgi:lysophospholipase L1-like esterase